jgi:diacylglycerol kinase family enzyme
MTDVGHALAMKVLARPADIGQPMEIEVDGEITGCLPATFQILPRALRVRCPTNTV